MTIAQLKPQHGYDYLQNGQIRRRCVFDGGNRFLKWIDPTGRIQIIPSCIKELDTWEDAQPDERCSVIIGYQSRRYAIGQVAQELDGKPVFSDDKCQLAEILALVAIEPNPGHNSVLIEKIAIALPDSRNQQAVAGIKRVEGTKEFTRNGKNVIATIRHVEPCDETRPAYHYAMSKGMFKHPKYLNGIMDLGGGTGIARLYSSSGTLNRAADIVVPGTCVLAQRISASLIPVLGHSPNLTLIMDAIAAGETGGYRYGTTDIYFKSQFLKFRQDWLNEIKAHLRTAWHAQLNQLGEVLIIGGSAKLAEPLVEASKGRFKIAVHPQVPNFSQVINLYGMMEG